MTKTKNIEMKEADLRSHSIYSDKNGRYVYYIKRKKRGYIIPHSDIKVFEFFQARIFIGVVVATLINNVKSDMNIYLCFGFGFLLYLLMELYYRFILLKKYSILDKYEPENEYKGRNERYSGVTKSANNFMTATYLGFGTMIIFLTFILNISNNERIMMALLGVVCFSYGLINIYNYRHFINGSIAK